MPRTGKGKAKKQRRRSASERSESLDMHLTGEKVPTRLRSSSNDWVGRPIFVSATRLSRFHRVAGGCWLGGCWGASGVSQQHLSHQIDTAKQKWSGDAEWTGACRATPARSRRREPSDQKARWRRRKARRPTTPALDEGARARDQRGGGGDTRRGAVPIRLWTIDRSPSSPAAAASSRLASTGRIANRPAASWACWIMDAIWTDGSRWMEGEQRVDRPANERDDASSW